MCMYTHTHNLMCIKLMTNKKLLYKKKNKMKAKKKKKVIWNVPSHQGFHSPMGVSKVINVINVM